MDATLWYLAISAFLLWIFPITQVVIAVGGRKRGPDRAVPPEEAVQVKAVYLLVPALNEGRVIAPTAEVLSTLPSSAEVTVVVVNDGSDDDTEEVLSHVTSPKVKVLTRTPPKARQGKGAALNYAYHWVCKDAARKGIESAQVVVGIVDADGRPSENMLKVMTKLFADRQVAAVQTQVVIRNTSSFWGLIQDEEFSVSVDAAQSLRDRLGSVALGGNGQFTRLSALLTLGDRPWSDCLVEDLDLGLRLHVQGFTLRYTNECYITQQGLSNTAKLLKQRTRWSQGNIQCLTHAREVTKAEHLRRLARAEMLVYLTASIAAIIGSAALVLGLALMLSHPSLDEIPDAGAWMVAMLLPSVMWSWLYARKRMHVNGAQTVKLILGYPALVFLTATSIIKAWVRHLRGQQAWAKTEREVETEDRDPGGATLDTGSDQPGQEAKVG